MDYFNYKKNILYAEKIPVEKIAKEIKTPFYLYSKKTFIRHYNVFDQAINLPNKIIAYAVKANSNIAILNILAKLGCGADVVSQGEIYRAIKAGIDVNKIIFSGVGKTEEELIYALNNNIKQINCESKEEIFLLNEIAKKLNKKAPIALRINPDIDANTHAKISTGSKENKFGINICEANNLIKEVKNLSHINLQAIAVHIGSQITKLEVFKKAFTKVFDFINEINSLGINIDHIDLGGGLGVPYGKNKTILPNEYGEMIKQLATQKNLADKTFIFEPGRLIAANSGILVSSVILVKKTSHKNFVILDTAMNDLLRPALYDAIHDLIPVEKNISQNETNYDFVGPICETSDIFAKDLSFQSLLIGDLIAIRSSGAYGSVLSSEYNSRPLIPEILVDNDIYNIIRSRPNLTDLTRLEKIPQNN
jgi:diaminopimelate decarboxylase